MTEPSGIDKYQAVKPQIETAFCDMMTAGRSICDFVRYIIDSFGAAIKPDLMRWFMERSEKHEAHIYQQIVRPYLQDMQREFRADHTTLKHLRAGIGALIGVFGVRRAKSYSLRFLGEARMRERTEKTQNETDREFFLQVRNRFDEDLMPQWMKDLPQGSRVTDVYLPPTNDK